MKAHDWSVPEYAWSGDGSMCIAKRACNNEGCGASEIEVARTTSEVTKPATNKAKGTTKYTAEFENAAFATQTKELQDIPALIDPDGESGKQNSGSKAADNGSGAKSSGSNGANNGSGSKNNGSNAGRGGSKTGSGSDANSAAQTVGAVTYAVKSEKKKTAVVVKAANKKKVVIPATVKIKGKTYKVTGIKAKAFAKTKTKTIIVKTKYLTKKSVKKSLKKSKVKVVKVKVGGKKANKKYKKKYKKIFTKRTAAGR